MNQKHMQPYANVVTHMKMFQNVSSNNTERKVRFMAKLGEE